jgi:hypothetical protein
MRLATLPMHTVRQPSPAAISRAARNPGTGSCPYSGTLRISCLNGATTVLSLGCALKTANPLGYAFFERCVAGPLLFTGGDRFRSNMERLKAAYHDTHGPPPHTFAVALLEARYLPTHLEKVAEQQLLLELQIDGMKQQR